MHSLTPKSYVVTGKKTSFRSNAPGQTRRPKGDEAFVLDDNVVYLEDIDPSAPRSPSKINSSKDLTTPEASKAAERRSKFHDHDPYKLPQINMEAAVARRTATGTIVDPRLATEDELRSFIEEMRPEDFDVSSPAFRELPVEVQYEIIGDLRLKSRQTSYKRLQTMLRNTTTPMDFSKQQIMNLKQRNSLTQQLLVHGLGYDADTTKKEGIVARVASERNREYVLIKNDGENGGWILGIKDDGTAFNPILIDQDAVAEEEEDSDMDMEEVSM